MREDIKRLSKVGSSYGLEAFGRDFSIAYSQYEEDKPKVSLIILTCNNKQILAKCLNSVVAIKYRNLEVIVVDNASSDGTSKLISENFSNVKIVRSERNLGYAGGNNLGIRNARGDYVILLNDDTIVDPKFVSRLVEGMEAEPRATLGSCKIYGMKGRVIQYAGGFINDKGYPIMRGYGEEDNGQYDRLGEVEWASGACMIIRRECLEKIGLFDYSFFIYYEDTDLSFRARKAGYKVIYIPSTIIRHSGSTTTRRHWRYNVYGNRNRIRFLLKHFGKEQTAKAIAWDLWNISPLKNPYLFIALIWNYPMLLSAVFHRGNADRLTINKTKISYS
ncbi:MAG: glycosyltransferase family 2 protein [Nitrososphaerales archaeon]